VYESLLNILQESNLPFEIIEHDEITCVDDGVSLLGFDGDCIIKTLGFDADGAYVFIAVQGYKRLDYKKLVQTLKIKRDKLKKISPEIVENDLGYQQGGLSPLTSDARISVYFDSGIIEMEIVYCGIGTRDKTLKISPKNLIYISGGIVADLSKC
jgi:Cys-tRNA(Pro)/Cys-tRNA(Cys) deacylase